MKRSILTLISAFAIIAGAYSQNVDDALRYSQDFYGGTARAISMGDAFTSLGADLSAISINPAGTGMFRSMEISFTPQISYNSANSTFNGTKTSDYRYNLALPQIGIVGCLISHDRTSGLVALNFAYSYNAVNNYNANITMSGVSQNSSMADYWAKSSQGINYTNLTGGAGIAFDTWIMDTISGSHGNTYGTTFSHYGDSTTSKYGQTITRVVTDDGYKGEHTFSVGANFSNKLFLGATLGITVIQYTGHYDHMENDINNTIFDFKDFAYTNHFEESGTGYSFKIGAIYRPIDLIRIGFAFHAPVPYRMHEYFYDNITSNFDNGDTYSSANEAMTYDYTLTTPMKLLGGISFQIRKVAIISADYEYIDYRQARFSNGSDGYDFSNENQSIQSILNSASNFRVGVEYRIGSVYIRGGYGYYGSAFAKGTGELNENMVYNSISGGVGFRQHNFYLDLAYSDLFYTQKYLMYDGQPDPAILQIGRNTFTATIGMKF
ncbi:MAG: hypothetical protein ABR974_03710 [Bacteroidales bacterium]